MKKISILLLLVASLSGYAQTIPYTRVSNLATGVRATTLGGSYTPAAGTVTGSDTYLQALQKVDGNIANAIPTAITYPLESYSNVGFAWSPIRLKSTATKAFRIRRATDNVEQDFYFNSLGRVDLDILLKFLNTDRGYVSVLYNQISGGPNAVQTTNANQAYIVINKDQLSLRFEADVNGTNGVIGQFYTYTYASGQAVNNTAIMMAYKANSSSGTVFNNFLNKRNFFGSSSNNLELYINGLTPNYEALEVNNTATPKTTTNLYAHVSNSFLAVNASGSATKVWSNTQSVSLTANSSATSTVWYIGQTSAGTGQPYAGDIFSFIQFNTSVSDADVTAVQTALTTPQKLALDTDYNIVVAGNSETYGTGATDNQNWVNQTNLLDKLTIRNFAIGGNTYALATTKVNAIDNSIKAGKTNILVVWLGTNDIVLSSRTPTQVYNDAVTFAQARRTAGFNRIIMVTMMSRTNATVETNRLALNVLIKANTTDWEEVIDIGGDSRLLIQVGGSSISNLDHTYYSSDDIHLNNEGYRLVASFLDASLAQYVTSSALNYDVRIGTLENRLRDLENRAILNRVQPQKSTSLAVSTGINAPFIFNGGAINSILKLQGTTATGTGNLGTTVIEPLGGRAGFGLPAPTNEGFTFNNNTLSPVANLDLYLVNTKSNKNSGISFREAEGTGLATSGAIIQYLGVTSGIYQGGGLKISAYNGIWFNTAAGQKIRFGYGDVEKFYMQGDLFGIGISPTAYLHIKAGTATAGTAPIKLTAGVNTTVAVSGQIEFDGTNYFGTNSTATRYTFAKTLTATATLDFPSTAAQTSADLTITVTGAADGDAVSVGPVNASMNANSSYTAWVSAANTVSVRLNNYSSGAIDPASGTFRVSVIRY